MGDEELAAEALLSPARAAQLFDVHQQTLRAWEKAGLIAPVRLPRVGGKPGDRRYRVADLRRLVAGL